MSEKYGLSIDIMITSIQSAQVVLSRADASRIEGCQDCSEGIWSVDHAFGRSLAFPVVSERMIVSLIV